MTLTLDLKPETEVTLRQKAALQGLSLNDYALTLLERDAGTPPVRAATRALRGKYAHTRGSVEDFLRDKHEENAREIAKGF